jgi:outer membrane lipoprotein SlyB
MKHASFITRPTLAAVLALAGLAGCATQEPVVYQKPATPPAVQQLIAKDLQQCRQQALSVVGLNGRQAEKTGQSAARTGIVGFAATAVGGLVSTSKDVWQRARAGAAAGATGAAVKTLLEWNDPDEVHQEYVERCMDERGHAVLGWR